MDWLSRLRATSEFFELTLRGEIKYDFNLDSTAHASACIGQRFSPVMF
jgi:hypothetical protein